MAAAGVIAGSVSGLGGANPSGVHPKFWKDFVSFITSEQDVEELDVVGAKKGILAGHSNTLKLDVKTKSMDAKDPNDLAYVNIEIDQANYPKNTVVFVDYNGYIKEERTDSRLQSTFDKALKILEKVAGKKAKLGKITKTKSPTIPKVEVEILDLLSAFLHAALNGSRPKTIISPWPSVWDPNQPSQYLVDPNLQSTAQLQPILDKLGCPAQHAEALKKGDLGKLLSVGHPGAPGLVKWLIKSNPCHWAPLKSKDQLPWLSTPHQFFLVSETPGKEKAFAQAAKTYGTAFAFHGSRNDNWHTILAQGLKNMSNTPGMLNGSAHGAGIYLSQNSGLSMAYSQNYYGARIGGGRSCGPKPAAAGHSCDDGGRFLFDPSKWVALALCEVVKSPFLNKSTNIIWTQAKNDHCAVRLLLLYPAHAPGPSVTIGTSPRYEKDLHSLCSKLRK